jgi:Tol biopolymer transport system component
MKKELYQMRLFMILILISFITVGILLAQGEQLSFDGKPEVLISREGEFYMSPVWSPDGSMIAFTQPRYNGLLIFHIDDGRIEQITDEESAGFGFSWSEDSRSLLARVSKSEGVRRLTAIKIFNIVGKEQETVLDYRTGISGIPGWADNAVVLYSRGKTRIMQTSGDQQSAWQEMSIQSESSLIRDGTMPSRDIESIDPLPGEQYLNAVYSPDKRQIVFEVMGGDLYVVNPDGTGLTNLGRGYRPQWSPDSDYIVYMITEDDGHNYTDSDIYAIRADGTGQIRLTDSPSHVFMNPSWSPDGSRIVFNNMNDGRIYVLEVSR